MTRCTKGIFGKYCILTVHENRSPDTTRYCTLYSICDSDNKVNYADIPQSSDTKE